MSFRSKFFRYKLQKFGVHSIFPIQYILKQHGIVEDISCFPTWLPPYKPKKILQSLSGHITSTSQSVSTYKFGRTLKMGHLPADKFC